MNTRVKGTCGEDWAIEYLQDKGFSIQARNFRVAIGEIDIVARDTDGTLVFVEVKSARTDRCGHPFSWITRAKQRTIARVAQWYMKQEGITSGPCRFDAIAIVKGRLEHLKNCFLV